LKFFKKYFKGNALLKISAASFAVLIIFYHKSLPNFFLKCLLGFFISSIFYCIVNFMPERRKRENIQKRLAGSYKYLKEQIILQIQAAVGNSMGKDALLWKSCNKIFYCENDKIESIRSNEYLKSFCKGIINGGNIYADNITLAFKMFDSELTSALFLYAVNDEKIYNKSIKAFRIISGYKSIKYETKKDIEVSAVHLWKFFAKYNNLNEKDYVQDYIDSLWKPLSAQAKKYFDRLSYSFWMNNPVKCFVFLLNKIIYAPGRNKEFRKTETINYDNISQAAKDFSKALKKLRSHNPGVWADGEIRCAHFSKLYNNCASEDDSDYFKKKLEPLIQKFVSLSMDKHCRKMKKLHKEFLQKIITKTRKKQNKKD